MPSMANIAVNDNAAVSRTYTAATPSAGDRSPAVWRRNDVSGQLAARPRFTMMTRDNAKQNGRVVEIRMSYPVIHADATTGLDVVDAVIPLVVQGTLPTNVDASSVIDAFVQFGNLLVSTLIRSAIEEGYAPT